MNESGQAKWPLSAFLYGGDSRFFEAQARKNDVIRGIIPL